MIGGQTLSSNGASLHVNGDSQILAPQPAPVTIQPASVQTKSVPQNTQRPEIPIRIAGLMLTPVEPSPIPPREGQPPRNSSPAQQPGQSPLSTDGDPGIVQG